MLWDSDSGVLRDVASNLHSTLLDDEATETTQVNVLTIYHSVKDAMIKGENVYLRGFGSFIIKKRAEKVARNISKNTTITIPEHNIPAFKPAKSFAGEVK